MRRAVLSVLAALLSACASHHPLPLPAAVGAPRIADLKVDAARMPVRSLARHVFDPRDGLDETETAMLAVAASPELQALRAAAGVAHAQAFAAGLLPDPQLTWSQDFVTGGSGGPGATSPFGLGIAYDVGSLLTRSSRQAAARWHERQVDLDLLWAEWQTVARARSLFAQVQMQRAQLARLDAETQALQSLRARVTAASNHRQLSEDAAALAINAVADLERQDLEARVRLEDSEQALRLLLGLRADAALPLQGEPQASLPSAARLHALLADLPARRPDLLALQAGYRAQDASLRAAILAQFPAINVGFTRARDNAGVYTSGYAVSLTLPLFDRNRGRIAIESATRQQLHDEYAARLLAAHSDVARLQAELALDDEGLRRARAHAEALDAARRAAETAWNRHALDWPTYLSLRTGALSAALAADAIAQRRAETAVALQTLLGADDWSASAQATMTLADRAGDASR